MSYPTNQTAVANIAIFLGYGLRIWRCRETELGKHFWNTSYRHVRKIVRCTRACSLPCEYSSHSCSSENQVHRVKTIANSKPDNQAMSYPAAPQRNLVLQLLIHVHQRLRILRRGNKDLRPCTCSQRPYKRSLRRLRTTPRHCKQGPQKPAEL